MRIQKITLNNFQAFPSIFEVNLGRSGKNFLLYGENGSGKSSIYRALQHALRPRKSKDWQEYRNLFNSVDTPVSFSLTTTLNDQFTWRSGEIPPSDPHVHEAGRRAGFLDYRSLLRLSSHPELTPLTAVFFRVVVEELLPQFEVVLPTEGSTTLAELWQEVLKHRIVPPKQRQVESRLRAVREKSQLFNTGLTQALDQLRGRVTALLDYFDEHYLDLEFIHPGVQWKLGDPAPGELIGQELNLDLRFREYPIATHIDFLNEARLSAIALSIFLAGVALSNPPTPPGREEPLRLLVLDDALMGLDLKNRTPLMNLLDREFPDFQILLFTHDRVWFDMAREGADNNKWVTGELFMDEKDGLPVPLLKLGNTSAIDIARRHMREGDLRAAAVYTRAAFEEKLKAICERNSLLIPFKTNPNHVSTNDLWLAVRDWNNKQVPPPLDDALVGSLDSYRSSVLNRLSHSGSSSLTRSDVRAAIRSVNTLCHSVRTR